MQKTVLTSGVKNEVKNYIKTLDRKALEELVIGLQPVCTSVFSCFYRFLVLVKDFFIR